MLTARRARKIFDYDPKTGFLIWKKKISQKVVVGRRAGCVDKKQKRRAVRIDGRIYYEHRVIWLMVRGRWPRDQIDHVNRDAGDNRFANLREATGSQNSMNKGARRDNQLGLRGVIQLSSGSFRARFQKKHLGCFATKEEASAAWHNAATRCYRSYIS